jgi:PilZ domain
MEHRWGERIAIDIPIRLTLTRSKVVGIGRLTNLSLSGGLISSAVELRVLSHIHIALRGPRLPKSEALNIAAFVSRRGEHEFGIEWLEFAPPAIAEIVRMTTLRSKARVPQAMPADFYSTIRQTLITGP